MSVYFTPSRYSDPVLDFIENAEIDCTTKGSKILVSQSKWQKNRAKRLMNLLTTLHNRGCEVKAITNNADDANDYLDDLPSFNLPYPVMLFDRQKTANVDTHSKTLLIEANMKIGSEVSYKKVVFTGSANMSTFSLEYGDETIVRIIDDNVYDKFVDYWQKQEEIIKRCSN
ncbi:MAG: phospholipase D-like domain-containing protein [Bdellovibrionota bacterium]